MASEKNHQKYQKPLAPYQSAKPRPLHRPPAPKLGKAEGRGITGGNTMQFSKSFRLSEIGRWESMGRRELGDRMPCVTSSAKSVQSRMVVSA